MKFKYKIFLVVVIIIQQVSGVCSFAKVHSIYDDLVGRSVIDNEIKYGDLWETYSRYICQNSSETVLSSTYDLLMSFDACDFVLQLQCEVSEDEKARLNEEDIKAFLMAFVRMDLRLGEVIPVFDYSFGIRLYSDPEHKDKIFFGAVVYPGYPVINVFSSFLDNANMLGQFYGRNRLFINMGGSYYSAELASILYKILPSNDSNSPKDVLSDLAKLEKLFDKVEISPYENLVEKYNFLKQAQNIAITADTMDGVPVELTHEAVKALLLGIVRLRAFYDTGDYSRIFREPRAKISGMAEHVLNFSISNHGCFKISVKSDKENIVYISSTGINKDSAAKSIFPKNGAYYSPEMYNMLFSIFSKIAIANISKK